MKEYLTKPYRALPSALVGNIATRAALGFGVGFGVGDLVQFGNDHYVHQGGNVPPLVFSGLVSALFATLAKQK